MKKKPERSRSPVVCTPCECPVCMLFPVSGGRWVGALRNRPTLLPWRAHHVSHIRLHIRSPFSAGAVEEYKRCHILFYFGGVFFDKRTPSGPPVARLPARFIWSDQDREREEEQRKREKAKEEEENRKSRQDIWAGRVSPENHHHKAHAATVIAAAGTASSHSPQPQPPLRVPVLAV